MQGRFELRDTERWYPKSEVYDWRARRLGKLATLDQTELPALFFVIYDEDYEQEVTEQNTMAFINHTDDDLDAIAILDHRDGLPFWFFRGTHDNFEELLAQVGAYATVIHNDCPQDHVEAAYLKRQQELLSTDIEHLLD